MNANKEKESFLDFVIYIVRRFLYEITRSDRYTDGVYEGCLIWIIYLCGIFILIRELITFF